MDLAERLKKIGSKQIPMHMPGHKRMTFAHLEKIDYSVDFTETPDSDDLHHPQSLLLESQKELASLCGAKRSFYSVNGSTACILSAVRASTRAGQKILVARNCHKSVFNAIELCSLVPCYLLPSVNEHGFFGSVDPVAVKEALEREGDVALVVLTSPTYEGVLSDVSAIAKICHEKGAFLLVDEAHGAHLDFFDPSCPSSVSLGADLVVQSYHKTLPSFTQTAVLHLCSNRVNERLLATQMALFQSSSPSYLLLCSLDGCMRYLKEQNGRLDSWFYSVKKTRERLSELKHLRIYGGEEEYRYDCSKICILTDQAGITGYQLYDLLYEQGIVCELAGYNLLVAMTGAADNEQTLEPLVRALLSIDCCLSKGELSPLPEVKALPQTAVPAVECFAHPVERLPLSSCVGRICGEMVYLYPPGIPMLLPGEVITEELTALIAFYGEKGVSVNGFEEGLLVLTNP